MAGEAAPCENYPKIDPTEMKRFAPGETIAVDDDDDEDFLYQAAVAAETLSVSASSTRSVQTLSKRPKPSPPPKLEGAYVDALRGAGALPPSSRNAAGRAIVDGGGGGGGGGGDACFKCGKVGHWSRDCDSAEFVAGGGGAAEVETKPCACGAGDCLVLMANTERNRGRKFFRCPVRQENGGCNFFEWCDGANVTASHGNTSTGYDNGGFSSLFSALPCPCGAGSCLILTAKTGNNSGQQFYRCPAIQGSSCGFFKWCNDQTTVAGKSSNSYGSYNSVKDLNGKSDPARNTSSCFKCGQGGHWARDCSQSTTEFSRSGVKPSTTSSTGSCYKCGKPGHWAKDCSASSARPWQRH
ncbi:hypothetical protein MLD38_032573 [Melastoma candidum]|uniref:Uncharacterized protein n=1 Tax=Melastoma candidum TaxID=119954 RepID=A0ACB9M6A3_9MYRT|nr:hypothetical protein MLD38_032573 [Melastoma candidum]